MPYHTRYFYLEFDPRNYDNLQHLLNYVKNTCAELTGCFINEYDLCVGRLPDNAELHFLKAPVSVPIGTECEYFL